MSVDIYINGRKTDVEDSIEMVRQVMDIFDISIRVVDYSKTISLPFTATNKEIFEGLRFTDSQFPYKRSYADVYVSGILIMKDAFVLVKKSTEKEYSVSFVSESKEIWKVIENDTLANLDLSDTSHTKTAALIKEQWESGLTPEAKFLYFLADYGGRIPSDNKVFGDYLVPSYRLSYLVAKINLKYGVNIVLPAFLSDTFITFSDANEIEETNDKVVYEKLHQPPTVQSQIGGYVIEEDGNYELRMQAGTFFANSFAVRLGSYYKSFASQAEMANFTSPILALKKGDRLSFEGSGIGSYYLAGLVQIIRKAIDVSGNKAFQNYKISDFLKEIIYQSASIPIKTGIDYDFVTLTEIVSNDAADWSSYFDSATEETYIIGKYGQNNWLRYKYAEAEDFNKDGLVPIPNVNLEVNKDIIKSTLYNTPVNSIGFTIGGTEMTSQQYHLWKRTVEQKDGVFIERYQGQAGRMFLLTGVPETTASNFTINVGTGTATTNKTVLANNEDYNFQRVVNQRYKEYSKILANAKIIDAVFKIPLIEFANFDFKRRIYVIQLQGYFIINRMIYTSGELMKVELIEANITPESLTPPDPDPDPSTVTMVFKSNVATFKNRLVTSGQTYTEEIQIIGDLTGTIELFIDGTAWTYVLAGNILSFDFIANVALPYGQHEITVTGVSNSIYLTIANNKPPVDYTVENPY